MAENPAPSDSPDYRGFLHLKSSVSPDYLGSAQPKSSVSPDYLGFAHPKSSVSPDYPIKPGWRPLGGADALLLFVPAQKARPARLQSLFHVPVRLGQLAAPLEDVRVQAVALEQALPHAQRFEAPN